MPWSHTPLRLGPGLMVLRPLGGIWASLKVLNSCSHMTDCSSQERFTVKCTWHLPVLVQGFFFFMFVPHSHRCPCRINQPTSLFSYSYLQSTQKRLCRFPLNIGLHWIPVPLLTDRVPCVWVLNESGAVMFAQEDIRPYYKSVDVREWQWRSFLGVLNSSHWNAALVKYLTSFWIINQVQNEEQAGHVGARL